MLGPIRPIVAWGFTRVAHPFLSNGLVRINALAHIFPDLHFKGRKLHSSGAIHVRDCRPPLVHSLLASL